MVDISKLSPVEMARRVHNSSDLNLNPYPKRSKEAVEFGDELMRLITEELLGNE